MEVAGVSRPPASKASLSLLPRPRRRNRGIPGQLRLSTRPAHGVSTLRSATRQERLEPMDHLEREPNLRELRELRILTAEEFEAELARLSQPEPEAPRRRRRHRLALRPSFASR